MRCVRACCRLRLALNRLEEHGETPPDGSPGLPNGVLTASREQWRLEFYDAVRAKEPDLKEDALKRSFSRSVLDLTTAKETAGEWFWLRDKLIVPRDNSNCPGPFYREKGTNIYTCPNVPVVCL
jgi:hypothetical protein